MISTSLNIFRKKIKSVQNMQKFFLNIFMCIFWCFLVNFSICPIKRRNYLEILGQEVDVVLGELYLSRGAGPDQPRLPAGHLARVQAHGGLSLAAGLPNTPQRKDDIAHPRLWLRFFYSHIQRMTCCCAVHKNLIYGEAPSISSLFDTESQKDLNKTRPKMVPVCTSRTVSWENPRTIRVFSQIVPSWCIPSMEAKIREKYCAGKFAII